MSAILNRIGTGFYFLWGLVHVVGGGSILLTLYADGGAAGLRILASATPAAVPDQVPGVASALLGFHAWNMFWIGGVVTVLSLLMGWKNSRLAMWLNFTLAGAADLGLVAALVLPGHIKVMEAMVGIGLFLLAAGFTLGSRVLAPRQASLVAA